MKRCKHKWKRLRASIDFWQAYERKIMMAADPLQEASIMKIRTLILQCKKCGAEEHITRTKLKYNHMRGSSYST
jgi:hypothetical protein